MPTIDLQETRRDLHAQRVRLMQRSREILEGAEAAGRSMTDEERANHSRCFDEASSIADRISDLTRQIDADHSVDEARASVGVSSAIDGERGEQRGSGEQRDNRTLDFGMTYAERQAAMNAYLAQQPGTQEAMHMRAFERIMRGGSRAAVSQEEARALQMDDDEAGGALVPPMEFITRLIQAVDNNVYIRQWATVETVTSAQSLGAASLDADPADPIWTAEIGTGDEDSTMDFGKREFRPRPLAKRIKVSRTLLRRTAGRAEGIVRQRLAYKFGTTAENAYLNGTGAEQPLGVMVASNDGIPTGRDFLTGATTSYTFDGLIACKYGLKTQYWPRSRWMFHRDGAKLIAQLKDADNQYLWRENVRVGEPDRLLGFPAFMSEYMPNTFTASQYVGILGDFSNYWIADSLAVTVQRLDELYAETNQVGFIGRLESDGMPVLAEAFARLKTDAS